MALKTNPGPFPPREETPPPPPTQSFPTGDRTDPAFPQLGGLGTVGGPGTVPGTVPGPIPISAPYSRIDPTPQARRRRQRFGPGAPIVTTPVQLSDTDRVELIKRRLGL